MGNVSHARWIEERLWDLGPEGVHVGSVVPEGFAAYARVLHPAYRRTDHECEPVPWSAVAAWTGRTVHPQMQFERIADLQEPYQAPSWGCLPRVGSLPPKECRTMAEVLREFTSTPDRCYFCLWDGYAFLDPYQDAPRVSIPDRGYLVFQGPLEAVTPFLEPARRRAQSPNLWWPEDRAWCVSTDVDLFDTYVGGSDACIEAIFRCADLEALPTTVEARVDIGADTINTAAE